MKQYKKHILVCELGSHCAAKGADGMRDLLKEIVTERGLEGQVKLGGAGCLGACDFGPNLVIYPDGIWYFGVQQADLARIIDETVIRGRIIEDRLFHRMGDPSVIEMVKDPVCGMIFRANKAMCSELGSEGPVYFCAEGCRQAYLADPEAYRAKKHHGHEGHVAARHDHEHHG